MMDLVSMIALASDAGARCSGHANPPECVAILISKSTSEYPQSQFKIESIRISNCVCGPALKVKERERGSRFCTEGDLGGVEACREARSCGSLTMT